MAVADWSELADDLIGEIAKNISCVEDFVLFSRVCPSWQLAAVKENWVSGRQLPWLALAEKEDEEASTNNKTRRRGFFNMNKKKRYDLEIPQLGRTRSWGSSLGCIVTINLDLEIHVINPLSGVKLNLPHLYTLKHMPYEHKVEIPHPNSISPTHPNYIEPKWFMAKYIIKAILCKKNEQLFVAVIYGEFEFLAIARPGDQSWSEVEREKALFQDVVFFDGHHYAVTHGGELIHLEFDWLQSPKSVTIVPPYTVFGNLDKKVYLVESMGDLLMVARYVNDLDDPSPIPYTTLRFDIYKFDTNNQKWIELKSLGDMALFVGDSYSISLCSNDVVGCESNVIYFTDDYHESWEFTENLYGGNDIGVFSLKENVSSPFLDDNLLEGDDLRSLVSCPIWMMPNLF